ncbi:MAG: glycoside hydrolase family 13 protein [Bacilli bacterium]|nr:glycoside hydrolase family 13 protein [Bacilli bacterium]
MRPSSFRHQSDSRYCFSLSVDKVLIRLAVAKEEEVEDVEVVYGDMFRFASEHKDMKMAFAHEDASFRYYEAIVTLFPMRIAYVFRVKQDGKWMYLCETGLGEGYLFDLAFISAFQFNGENPNDFVLPNPTWRGRVFYQVFPERFFSHLDAKAKPYVDTPWDHKSLKGKPRAFLGGDLWGVKDKLDYLASIGVGALYLTPIHPSPSNHKYDVLDYFEVDPSFGGKAALFNLVKKAHGLGIKVMLDMVFNHTAYDHPFFRDVRQKGKDSPYYDWYFVNGDKPTAKPLNYLCFSRHFGMPKLNTNNPKVQRYLISVGQYWMKEFDVDGYRLDVSDGVAHDFWIKFKIALKEIDPDVLLIGENWLNAESYLGNDQFNGVMNYPFLGVASGYLLGMKDAKQTAEGLEGLLMRYKDGHDAQMLNLLSSHDVQRTLNLCKGDKELSLMGHAMLMFFPGFPMVYYGEEIFMEGGPDPDNRRGMEWGSEEFSSSLHQTFVSLMRLHCKREFAQGQCHIREKNGLLYMDFTLDGHGYALWCNLTKEGKPFSGRLLLSNRCAGGEVWPKGFAVTEI